MANIMRLGPSKDGPRRIFLAVPAYSAVHPQLAYALMATEREFAQAGISLDMEIIHGHCHVDDCRNLLVRDFLETDATDLVFVDADLSWRPRDLIKLVSYERDVVAGIYPFKSDNLDFPCRLIPGPIWSDQDGLIEVDGVPTGFLRIKRSVLEEMEKRANVYLNTPTESDRRRIPIIFERTLDNGVRYSGDYSFCRKWKAMGGRIYIDPAMSFGHFGEKEWKGCFGDFLKQKAGIGFERLDVIRDGREDDETLLGLLGEWGNDWSADVEFLQAAIALARETNGPVLEFGSGLSTLVMAAANPNVIIHAIEDEPHWASKLKNVLAMRGIKNVEVHVTGMRNYQKGRWYDERDIPRENYSLLVIDGPSRSKGTRSVWSEIMLESVREAVWLMDDAADPAQIGHLRSVSGGRAVHVLGGRRRFAVSKKTMAAKKAA